MPIEVLRMTRQISSGSSKEQIYDEFVRVSRGLNQLMGAGFAIDIIAKPETITTQTYHIATIYNADRSLQILCYALLNSSTETLAADLYLNKPLSEGATVSRGAGKAILTFNPQKASNNYNQYVIKKYYSTAGTFVLVSYDANNGATNAKSPNRNYIVTQNNNGTWVMIDVTGWTGINSWGNDVYEYTYYSAKTQSVTLNGNPNNYNMIYSGTFIMYKMPDIVEGCMFKDLHYIVTSSRLGVKTLVADNITFCGVGGSNAAGGFAFPY